MPEAVRFPDPLVTYPAFVLVPLMIESHISWVKYEYFVGYVAGVLVWFVALSSHIFGSVLSMQKLPFA